MKKSSGPSLTRMIFSPIGLMVVVGLAGGFFVSDLFRGIASRQVPPRTSPPAPRMPPRLPWLIPMFSALCQTTGLSASRSSGSGFREEQPPS